MKEILTFISKDNKKVTVEIETKYGSNGIDWETLQPIETTERLSICGDCGDSLGQCYDDFEPTEAQSKLVEFWKTYHLNDLCAGTKAQTEALKPFQLVNGYDYMDACNYLESIGLLEDRGYRYGTKWLFKSFPKDELLAIIEDIKKENNLREETNAEINEKYDINDDDCLDDILEKLVKMGFNKPEEVIAILRNNDLTFADVANIEETSNHSYEVLGTTYYCGTEDELIDFADNEFRDSYIEIWKQAVADDYTLDGFEEWWEASLEEDLGGVLSRYDGRIYYETINGINYGVARS